MLLPNNLEEAIAQAQEATLLALADGNQRVQVELVFPEIELQAQSIAADFIPSCLTEGVQLKVFFPDTGAAALAKRDWGEVPFKIEDLGSSRSPVDNRIDPTDGKFLLICPSSIEIAQVERLCNLAGDRPVILLNPRLEDISIVGIGLAARQLRERFINTLYSCYYLKPLEGAVIFRRHPGNWQVWLEEGESYQLIAEQATKPSGDELDRIFREVTNPPATTNTPESGPPIKKKGFLDDLQKMWQALSR